jgi:hypothetical protein
MREAFFVFGCSWSLADWHLWNLEYDYASQGAPCRGESTWGSGSRINGGQQDGIVTATYGCLRHEGQYQGWPWGTDIHTTRSASWTYQQTCAQGSARESIHTETVNLFGGNQYVPEPPSQSSGGFLRAEARYESFCEWSYDREPCAVDPCDTPPTKFGACCPTRGIGIFGDGCIVTTPANCGQRSGIYQGDNTRCADVQCPPRGGCCLESGRCEYTTKTICELGLGGYRGVYLGDNVLCDSWNCQGPVGSCCIAGSCTSLTHAECERRSGRWVSDDPCPTEGMPCDPIPPGPGACCLPDGSCIENVSEANCASKDGKTLGANSSCYDSSGRPNCPNVGACCIPGQGCAYLNQASCRARGGTFQGTGTVCGLATCADSTVIPPISNPLIAPPFAPGAPTSMPMTAEGWL